MTILSLRVLCWILSFLHSPQPVPRMLGGQTHVIMRLYLADGGPVRVQHHRLAGDTGRHVQGDRAAYLLDVGSQGQVGWFAMLLPG